jgi:hypothetical protein
MANEATASMHGVQESVYENPLPAQGTFYRLVPLAIQREGDSYLVGNLKLNRFFQIPEIGVRIIRMLQEGLSIETVKTRLAEDAADVDGFIDTLVSLKLARRATAPGLDGMAQGTGHGWLRWAVPLARALFTWPFALAYLAVVACGIAAAIAEPSILPDRRVFFISHDRTLFFLALLTLYFPIVALHEMGHILAAARRGFGSDLGIGTRLWNIVVEVDLTALLSLPRSQRYFPLLAGLGADILSVSLLFILLAALSHGHANEFLIHVIRGLVMQTLLTMLWQTNIFVRTDLYYVLCTWLGFPDLDRDARRYLWALVRDMPGLIARLTPAALRDRLAMAAATCSGARHLRTVQLFSLVWVAGRAVSIFVLVTLLLPTLGGYMADNYHAIRFMTAQSIPYDSICFSFLAIGLTMAGLVLWLAQNRPRLRA